MIQAFLMHLKQKEAKIKRWKNNRVLKIRKRNQNQNLKRKKIKRKNRVKLNIRLKDSIKNDDMIE